MAVSGQITPRDFLATFENFIVDKTGSPTAEHGWVNAAIYESALSARATLIRAEQLNDSTSTNKYMLQSIGCLELQEVPTEECPCAPPSGCTWFRTVDQVPTPIGTLHSVTAIGGNLSQLKHYTYRDWGVIKYSFHARNPAERKRSYYTIKNNYTYLTDSGVKAISTQGYFYDPVETQRHPQCGQPTDTCFPFLDYNMYIDPAQYQTLISLTYQLISGLRQNTPLDISNNGLPDGQK